MKKIIYIGLDEVLVTTEEEEKELLKDYFFAGSGRSLEDYEREEEDVAVVQICSRMIVH